jgi:hypothetical protein
MSLKFLHFEKKAPFLLIFRRSSFTLPFSVITKTINGAAGAFAAGGF